MAAELGPWPEGVSERTAILWVRTLLEMGRMSLPSSLYIQLSSVCFPPDSSGKKMELRETREKHEAFVAEYSK